MSIILISPKLSTLQSLSKKSLTNCNNWNFLYVALTWYRYGYGVRLILKIMRYKIRVRYHFLNLRASYRTISSSLSIWSCCSFLILTNFLLYCLLCTIVTWKNLEFLSPILSQLTLARCASPSVILLVIVIKSHVGVALAYI